MAKLAGKTIISVNEMSQEIDLKRYLGKNPTPEEKRFFGELAIEQINQRTLDNTTIHGGNFKRYSKEYADRKGVSRDSVDLFLEGDMLGSLEYQETDNGVKIFIGGNDVETKKGFNHHTGDTLPKRPWFGVTTEEARNLAEASRGETETLTAGFTLAELKDALSLLGLESRLEL